MTQWHFEDDVCWVADCEVCDVPMVVWRRHGTDPPPGDVDHMVRALTRVADTVFAGAEWSLDRNMRQIPDHFHAHARDKGWYFRRFR
ncbi:MAG TPA: hypothetical protein VMZ22_07790 [Acidimicrobiales bacterium]|nr:hypothetical protein [Acidimicrobiales bacterium]